MSELSKKKCLPCEAGASPLAKEEQERHLKELEKGWFCDGKVLAKEYKFKNFKEALAFVNDIGKVAEEEGHHPDIELSWGRVGVLLTTHKIGGLSEADFIMAAKTDVLFTARKG